MIKLWFNWFLHTQLMPTGIISSRNKEPGEKVITGYAILGRVMGDYMCSVCRVKFTSYRPRRLCRKWSCYKASYYEKAMRIK